MDYLVCPDDGARLTVVDARGGEAGRPLVRCPGCGRHFVFGTGGLRGVEPPPAAPAG